MPAAEIAEMGREISTSGQRLERLIENFLVYAQLEIVANDDETVKSLRDSCILEPAQILRQSAMTQADRLGRLNDLVVDAADLSLPMAEDYFKKIITELVQNAFKYSSAGTPVKVRLAAVGDEIEFSVRDAGRGFSPEQIHKIGAYVQFERKMQDVEGLGLGLAIAKKMAELHGGALAIESGQGTGSVVTVKLPAAKGA